MRWDKRVTLQRVEPVANSEGVESFEVVAETTVFANSRNMGMRTWVAAREAGLHASASLQVRSMEFDRDYNRCSFDGRDYEIERVYDTGEYTTLTLKHRLSSGRGEVESDG